jgi:hypothetical protein
MDVCVVLLYTDSSMEHEGQKDLKYKMDQRGKTPDRQKKIPPWAWMSVSCECCVLSGLCDGLITRLEESYRLWCVSNVCYHQTSTKRGGPGPYKAVEP